MPAISDQRSLNQNRSVAKKAGSVASAADSTTLVAVVKRGVNDGEIAAIVRHALEWRCVRGVTFQPVQDAGRNEGFDPKANRMVLSQIRCAVAEAGVFGLEEYLETKAILGF